MQIDLVDQKLLGITRTALGIYIFVFAILLYPYLAELYTVDGLIYQLDGAIVFNPLFSPFLFRESFAVYTIYILQVVAAVVFTLGLYHRAAAILLWFCHVYLFNLNPYTNSPEYAYLGWLLLAFIFIPNGIAFSVKNKMSAWQWSPDFRKAAWLVLAVSYTNSGVLKALSPGWLEGSALGKVALSEVNSYGWTIHIAKAAPWLFTGLNWVVLGIEALAILFIWKSGMRKYFWCASVLMHIGILLMMQFAQVSLGMLVFHLFLFDPKWLKEFKTHA